MITLYSSPHSDPWYPLHFHKKYMYIVLADHDAISGVPIHNFVQVTCRYSGLLGPGPGWQSWLHVGLELSTNFNFWLKTPNEKETVDVEQGGLVVSDDDEDDKLLIYINPKGQLITQLFAWSINR